MLTALTWVLAASESPTDFLPGLGQLGLGALIVAPSYVAVWKLWQTLSAERETYASSLSACEEQRRTDLLSQLARERELSSHIIPTLADSAQVIAQAPALYRHAVEEQTQSADLRKLLTDLGAIASEIRDKS